MRCKQRQRGFVLLMAVAMIPLFGLAILLTTAQTGQLSRQLKRIEWQAEQKNLLLSAEVWLAENRKSAEALKTGESITVPIADVASCPAVCTAGIVAGENGRTVLMLTLTVEQSNRTIVVKKEIGT